MLLLTLTLVFMLFRRVEVNNVPNKSRWLMAAGTTLLGLQFMLQFTLRLREMGETQAVILNMIMLVPAAWLLIIAVLYLQRQGRLTWYEWLAGPVGWIIIVILILSATLSDDLPFFSDTPTIRRAEYTGAVIFFIIIFYYLYLQLAELRHIRRSLKNFYDHDMSNLLRWMELCILVLAGTAIFIPAAILLPGRQLSFFGVFCIGGIYYLVLSFKDYVQGRNIVQVMAAQKNAVEAGIDNDANNTPTINEDDMKRVQQAVERWTENGNYLHSGITMAQVSSEMHISQPLLRSWFHASGYESYPDWIQRLRVEHAKKLMSQHPDWALEAIAEQCGFSSRNYFHKVFQKLTGKTPNQYMTANISLMKTSESRRFLTVNASSTQMAAQSSSYIPTMK